MLDQQALLECRLNNADWFFCVVYYQSFLETHKIYKRDVFYMGQSHKNPVTSPSSFSAFSTKRRKKGVSPLIASVLLIAFTLSIGAFMSTWLQDITKKQTSEAADNSKPECQYANLNIQNVTFTNSTTKLRIDVENTGTKSVAIRSVRIIYLNDSTAEANFTRITISAGDSYPLVMYNTTDNSSIRSTIRKLRLVTDCPNNNLEYSGSSMTII